ncbi:MAG: UvrD-helicase domain-containing protein [Candidatus Gastranaerophilales bacterium]|nr:UvrD-helicase domain-containing protein [Candidatus Gastranaerophilales bacterium]
MQTMPFLQGLNEQQNEAVIEKNGSILVLAGAGSGKTKVLTSRIANLVKSGVSPNDILAVTFTNKAAKEMQARLSNYLGEEVVKRMWVGTFHNICGRILRRDLENYKTKDGRKWDNNYVIYDDTDTKTIIKNALKKLNIDEKSFEIKAVKAAISNAKNKMQDAYQYATLARDYYTQKISEIYYEYERQLVLNNALDFDDMLMLAVNLLKENEEVRKKYATRFQHILVDEFQDTNKAQYDLINYLYPSDGSKDKTGSLCAVGDVDQSIYSWRGADFKIILNFQKDYVNTKLIKLEQNYRSTGTILEAANEVIKNNEERLEKNLYSNKGEGEKISLYEAQDDFGESRYIAKKIENLRVKKDDIAILYRTNSQSRSIEEALMSYSIPYRIVGGLKFYDRKEIKDIIAYLKLIYNHNDSQALKRIINEPKRGLGDTTIQKLALWADEREESIYQALKHLDEIEEINAGTKAKLQNFFATIEAITAVQNDYSLSEFVTYVLEATGYSPALRQDDNIENQSRLENLEEFINVVKEFEEDDLTLDAEDDMGMLGNFLSQVALVSDIDEADKDKKDEQAVTLMTLHAAKGLEFPVVFMAGMEDGIFPHGRSIAFGVGHSELEEERRLMYVGITRAKEKLFLTHAKSRRVFGNYQTNPKSRFLDEIPAKLIEEDSARGTVYAGKSSFSSAVSKAKEKKNSYNNNGSFTKTTSSSSSGTTNFASSLARIKASSEKAKTTSGNNLASSLANIKKITSSPTNPTKADGKIDYKQINAHVVKKSKPQDEPQQKLSVAEMIAKAKQKASETKDCFENRSEGLFPVGTRVFHIQFGVGKIVEIENKNYVVEFTKNGTKTLDSTTSGLKMF